MEKVGDEESQRLPETVIREGGLRVVLEDYAVEGWKESDASINIPKNLASVSCKWDFLSGSGIVL